MIAHKQHIVKKDYTIQHLIHKFSSGEYAVNSLYQSGVRINNIPKVKTKIVPILKEYSSSIRYRKGFKTFIKEVIKRLANK